MEGGVLDIVGFGQGLLLFAGSQPVRRIRGEKYRGRVHILSEYLLSVIF